MMIKKYNRPEKPVCCVVDSFCTAPANYPARPLIKATCFVCGEPVRLECSSRRIHGTHGKVRVCNDCQVNELDGGDDSVVMKRMQRRARNR